MEYNIDTLKERLERYLKGDDSALAMYKYRVSADASLEPKFPDEVQAKVNKLIKTKESETLKLSKNVLKLISMPYSKKFGEYVRFKSFKYELAFVDACRLLRINNITTKERLFYLTVVELAKKWKGARTKTNIKLNTVSSIINMAEILSNDVWREHLNEKHTERFYDAITLDSKSNRALKYKYCTATIERIKKQWKTKFGKDFSDINVRRWLDGQIINYVVEYALSKWGELSKKDILKHIYEEFNIILCEKTLQNHKGNINRFANAKTEKQINKEHNRYEHIKKLIEEYGKKWKKQAETKDITWYKRHKDLFCNE